MVQGPGSPIGAQSAPAASVLKRQARRPRSARVARPGTLGPMRLTIVGPPLAVVLVILAACSSGRQGPKGDPGSTCRPAAVAVFDLDELGNPDTTKVQRGTATLCWSIDSAGFLIFSTRMPDGDMPVSLRLPKVEKNAWAYVIKGDDGKILGSQSLTFRKDGSVSAASWGSKYFVLTYTEPTPAPDGGKR
jgi:hypothetical protein